jgi:segregation and condensation protein B
MVKNTKRTVKKSKDSQKKIPDARDMNKSHSKRKTATSEREEKSPLPTPKLHEKDESVKEDIKSLKQMKEKILERYEEQILSAESRPAEEPSIVTYKTHKEHIPNPTTGEEKESHGNEDKSKVEAILFALGKYVDDEMISQLCELDKRHARKALEELKQDYDKRNGALIVFQEGNSWKINVREKYLTLVRKIVADTELSKSIMETLAVIAWKTPINQSEVVRIRGNKCYDHIAELETAGFITKDKKGRSYVLKTTEKFYNYFDIEQKNLKGVMGEAKMPAQTTLEPVQEPEEIIDSKEKLLKTLETIETKSIVYTDDDKNSQREFLEQMNQKITDAAKRTDEYASEIPRPMHEQSQPEAPQVPLEAITDQPSEKIDTNTINIPDEEDIVINTDVETGSHHEFQKATEQPQRIKQLTKKQLEKKFKDELQRVKEKSEQKK